MPQPVLQAANGIPGPTVASCTRVTLDANYLAELKPGAGPSFRFLLRNDTDAPIKLAEPVPTSAHWYAREGLSWHWRASNGAGGNPVDATQPEGKMFAYRPTRGAKPASYLTVPAHGEQEWVQPVHEYPILEFKPSCARCNHPTDREYRVIFAYAYLPSPDEAGLGLIPCGLRSRPVDVPPAR